MCACIVDKEIFMLKGLIKKEWRQSDPYIWGIIIFLYIISIVEVYSAIGREINGNVFAPILKHTILLFGGFVITYVTSLVPLKWFKKATKGLIVFAVVVLVLTQLIGEEINGAKRSLSIFGFSLQGSEVAKVTIVLGLAWVLARTQIPRGVNNAGIKAVIILVALFSGLLLIQGLTNMILFLGISVCMMLIGGVQFKKLFLVILPIYLCLGVLGLGATAIYSELKAEDKPASVRENVEVVQVNEGTEVVQKSNKDGGLLEIFRIATWERRLKDFTDPEPEYEKPTNSDTWQRHHSAMAMAHGGVVGVGPGNSRETAMLPLAFSDFIYAIIIEELGLIGGIILLGAYLAILIRAGLIARRCNRAYPALLVMGMASMIVLQALFNMAIAVGVFPVSGQPLPLISQGGSSILMMSFAFGVMLSVSRYGVKEDGVLIKGESESDLPEDVQAKNPTKLA